MNISSVGTPSGQVQATQQTDRRAQLQAMLLRKSVEMQQLETDAVMKQSEGKGQTIDIRC